MTIIETDLHCHRQDWINENINPEFINNLRAILLDVDFEVPEVAIQKTLSDEIIRTFEESDILNFSTHPDDIRCTEHLQYKYDGLIRYENLTLGVEIQFRPDFLKDLTRFTIGYSAGRINAMIYIVAIDKNTINRNYHTMPKFENIANHLEFFTHWLNVPIIVIGINCDNNN